MIDPAPAAVAPLYCTFAAGTGTVAEFDFGRRAMRYRGVVLQVDRDAYFTRVAVDVADRRAAWRTVRDDALVYRAGADSPDGSVTFAPVASRFVRIRVLDGRSAFPLRAAVPIAGDEASRRPRGETSRPSWLLTTAFLATTLGLAVLARRMARGESIRPGAEHAEEAFRDR